MITGSRRSILNLMAGASAPTPGAFLEQPVHLTVVIHSRGAQDIAQSMAALQLFALHDVQNISA